MVKFVSYVPDEAIEKDAQALLAEYAHARGDPTSEDRLRLYRYGLTRDVGL